MQTKFIDDNSDKEFTILGEPFEQIGRKLKLVLATGRLLLENGADTHRVYRDMMRAAEYMGIPRSMFNLHIMYTTLLLNISDGKNSYTTFEKCSGHRVNMGVVSAVGKLVWRANNSHFALYNYEDEILRLSTRGSFYSTMTKAVCASIASAGTSLIFGADWIAFWFTAIAAFCGFVVKSYLGKCGLNMYVGISVAAFISTTVAYFTQFLPMISATPWHPMVACCLYMVPGVPMINTVNDMVNRFLVAGMARLLNTVLICGGMTIGIIGAIHFCHVPDFIELQTAQQVPFGIYVLGAILTAGGYSVMFNIKPRLICEAAIGGALCVCIRNFCINSLEMDMAISSFVGATVVCVMAMRLTGIMRAPLNVLVVPALIPLIPGVLLYRLYFVVINLGHVDFINILPAIINGVEGFLVVIATAIGAAIPSILRQFYTNSKQKLHLEEFFSDFYDE